MHIDYAFYLLSYFKGKNTKEVFSVGYGEIKKTKRKKKMLLKKGSARKLEPKKKARVFSLKNKKEGYTFRIKAV